MKNNDHELIVSGVHLELTQALKDIVREKIEKLFRHEERILRVRVELEFNSTVTKQDQFIAKGHIEIYGKPMVVSEASDDIYKSIDLAVTKLDRMLRRRSRLKKVKRKHPHEIDIPAEIPKTQTA